MRDFSGNSLNSTYRVKKNLCIAILVIRAVSSEVDTDGVRLACLKAHWITQDNVSEKEKKKKVTVIQITGIKFFFLVIILNIILHKLSTTSVFS